MNAPLRLIDTHKIVTGCPPAALTSTAGDGDYVSLKNYAKLTIVIVVDNGSTVTGGAVTLLQAKTVAAGSEKPLGFTKAWRNIDTGASDTLAEFAVESDTFTTDTTNAKNLLYVIEVDAADLDVDNDFDCVRIDVASMANAVGAVLYILHPSRYASPLAISAITD